MKLLILVITILLGEVVFANESAVLKYNPSGKQLWKASFSKDTGAGAEALCSDSKGNLLVCGNGFAVAKYDTAGKRLWAVKAQGFQTTRHLAVDRQGNVFVSGGDNRCELRKYSSEGKLVWKQTFPGVDPSGLVIAPDGSIHLVTVDTSDDDALRYQAHKLNPLGKPVSKSGIAQVSFEEVLDLPVIEPCFIKDGELIHGVALAEGGHQVIRFNFAASQVSSQKGKLPTVKWGELRVASGSRFEIVNTGRFAAG